jgi:hypothetical protein
MTISHYDVFLGEGEYHSHHSTSLIHFPPSPFRRKRPNNFCKKLRIVRTLCKNAGVRTSNPDHHFHHRTPLLPNLFLQLY